MSTAKGALCAAGSNVKTEAECQQAAAAIGKAYDHEGVWSGPTEHPYCLFAADGRDKVYFNTAGTATNAAHSDYQSICHNATATGWACACKAGWECVAGCNLAHTV